MLAKIKSSTQQLECPSGRKVKINSCGTAGQKKCPPGVQPEPPACVTSEMYQYQNAVISEAYKCVKDISQFPVTPEVLFEMYALESGFRSNYSYVGGVGVGQLTGIFIKDIHQKHRGRKILNQIQKSENSSCKLSQPMVAKDLKAEPSFKNRCDFIEYGEGFERNALYTLVGLANFWEKDIKPKMKDFNKKYSDNPNLQRAQQLALMNAYGPGGGVSARAALRRLNRLEPKEFIKTIQEPMVTVEGENLTAYTSKMNKKQNQTIQLFPEPLKLDFANNGARACVNTSL